MNDFMNVTVLGILQGVAEFLPISSSGHLVIGQSALGINEPGIRLDVFLHVGTVLAIFAYYRVQIWRIVAGLASSDAGRRKASWQYAAKIILSALLAPRLRKAMKAQG